MIQKAVILALLFIATSTQATDYYVDYTNGLDNDTGTSQETAWKTTKKVKDTTTFNSTDRIYFKCGETWQSELDCETYTFYIGNQTNKHYAYSFGSYGSGNQPVLPRIGFYGTQSGYRFTNLNIKYTGTNPARHACTIWELGNTDIEFDNCTFENNNYGDTVLVYKSNNITFKNCAMVYGNEAGLSLNDADNCTIEHCYTLGTVNGILCYQSSNNNIIRYNICWSSSHLTGAPIELGWGNPENNKVYNNTLYSYNYGLFVSGTNNLVYNNLINASSFALILSANTNVNAPKCSYNKIYNNTFATGKRVYIGHNLDPDNECIGNEIINNIFNISDDVTIQHTADSAGTSVYWQYNCFYSTYKNFKVFVDDVIINDFNVWQNNHHIFNNINKNPYVTNNGKTSSISPCNYTGLNLSQYFNTDYNNETRTNKWSVGCYQYHQTNRLNYVFKERR